VLDALRRWAGDELRSVNGQVDFILRRALIDAGRLKLKDHDDDLDDEAAAEREDSKPAE
jgi:hypothetical protein